MSTPAKPEIVYVTYIKTTPEALWEALTYCGKENGYWVGMTVTVGPNVGDKFEIRADDGKVWDEGEVLISDRPHKLSYTFHPVKSEGDEELSPSRVTFTLEPSGETVKLTLVHDRFDERSDHPGGVGRGWPVILSGLKSMLETDSGPGLTMDNAKMGESQVHDVSGRKRVFVSYIRASAEKVWHALTDGESSKKYMFGRRVESDWKLGSAFNYWFDEGHGLDVAGEIKEIDPPHKLVVTWQVVWMEEFKNLPPALVTYQIDKLEDELVRFTVIEEIPDEVPEKYLEGGKNGWPVIISGLKSLLELGEPLKITPPTQ